MRAGERGEVALRRHALLCDGEGAFPAFNHRSPGSLQMNSCRADPSRRAKNLANMFNGTPVCARICRHGGLVTAHGSDGQVVETMPGREQFGRSEEPEE